jgi:hypothetical protein
MSVECILTTCRQNAAASPLAPAQILTNLPWQIRRPFRPRALAASSSRKCSGDCLAQTWLMCMKTAQYDSRAKALRSFNPSSRGQLWKINASISGNRLITGAPVDDSGAEDAGSAFVYDLESPTPNRPVVSIPNPDPKPSRLLSAGPSRYRVTESRLEFPARIPAEPDAGLAFVYDLNSPTSCGPDTYVDQPVHHIEARVSEAESHLNGKSPRDRLANRGQRRRRLRLRLELKPRTATRVGRLSSAHDGRFGQTLAVSDSRIVVGAFYEAAAAGRVYIYDYSASLKTNPTLVLENPLPGSKSMVRPSRIRTWLTIGDWGERFCTPTPGVPISLTSRQTPPPTPRFHFRESLLLKLRSVRKFSRHLRLDRSHRDDAPAGSDRRRGGPPLRPLQAASPSSIPFATLNPPATIFATIHSEPLPSSAL